MSISTDVAMLAGLSPGPELVAALAQIDAAALSVSQAIDCGLAWERVKSWTDAQQLDCLVVAATPAKVIHEIVIETPFGGNPRLIELHDTIRDEIAAAYRWSTSYAQDRIDTGRLLAGPLAQTRTALAAGEIGPAHVRALVEAAERLPGCGSTLRVMRDQHDEMCAALEARVLPSARTSTVAHTRAAARRAVLRLDPHGEGRRRRCARAGRDVWICAEPDGITFLGARLPATDALSLMAAVDALAHDSGFTPDDATLIGERRAAALRELVLGTVPIQVALDVTVDLAMLMGLGEEPVELGGHGPIAVDELRDLLSCPTVEPTLRRLVTDPLTGHLLDRGRSTYQVPDALRAFIVARDRTCRFPGCRRRAHRCQIDHAMPWNDSGSTDRDNLGNS